MNAVITATSEDLVISATRKDEITSAEAENQIIKLCVTKNIRRCGSGDRRHVSLHMDRQP